MSEQERQSQQDEFPGWQPQKDEYCLVRPGWCTRGKFAKIIKPSPEEPDSEFLVKLIIDDPAMPFGFSVQIDKVSKCVLEPIVGAASVVMGADHQKTIRSEFRQKALEKINRELELALAEI